MAYGFLILVFFTDAYFSFSVLHPLGVCGSGGWQDGRSHTSVTLRRNGLFASGLIIERGLLL